MALVVILQAAMLLLADEVMMVSQGTQEQGPMLPFWVSFVLGMGMMLCGICWQMLYLGFLKTSAVYGAAFQQPMQLLLSGRPFFWRILFFQILLGFVVLFLNSVLASFLGGLIWKDLPMTELPSWFIQICSLVGVLILLKPLLFVPGQIIVYDTTVFQSIYQIRFYRFSGIENFLKIVFLAFTLVALSTLLVGLLTPKSMGYYIFSGLHHAVFSFILLSLTLIVVLRIQEHFESQRANKEENLS